MVQCEMCGAETSSPKTVKVEGAELQLCDSCSQFGTEVKTQETSSTSTKYSTTSDSASTSSSGGSSSSSSRSSGTRRRSDMFDQMDEIAQDYDQRIRRAREAAGMSQEDLANDLNEKASLIRKLEQSDILPNDDIRSKLERKLDISLAEGESSEDSEWESGSSTDGYTLGDVVKRKD